MTKDGYTYLSSSLYGIKEGENCFDYLIKQVNNDNVKSLLDSNRKLELFYYFRSKPLIRVTSDRAVQNFILAVTLALGGDLSAGIYNSYSYLQSYLDVFNDCTSLKDCMQFLIDNIDNDAVRKVLKDNADTKLFAFCCGSPIIWTYHDGATELLDKLTGILNNTGEEEFDKTC